MWKNIGRIFGEYIHINKFSLLDNEKNKIYYTKLSTKLIGKEILEKELKKLF